MAIAPTQPWNCISETSKAHEKKGRVYTHTHLVCQTFVRDDDNSTNLKKGKLFETLEKNFTFIDVRLSKVSSELSHLLKHHKFMDCDVPTEKTRRKSTFYRWQDQMSVHSQTHTNNSCITLVQVSLIPNCVLKKTVGKLCVVFERVPVSGQHMKEAVVRVHIVNLEGFLWNAIEENVTI